MDIFESARGERRRFMAAAALVLMVGILAPPAVNAAAKAIVVKRVKQPVKLADTTGGAIDSQAIPPLGTTQAPGSSGALAVRTFAGGGGLLGLGDCNTGTDPSISGSVTLQANPERKATALLMTGDDATPGVIIIQAPAVTQNYPVLQFTVEPGDEVVLTLGNGLSITPSDLVFSCANPGAGNDTKFVILGQ